VAEPELVLTLELGTTACTASLFTLDGAAAARAAVEYPTICPAPGWAEQDPEAWWDAAAAGCARLPAEARRRVVAIGLSSHRGGVVAADAQGRPLARCIIGADRRSAGEADALERAFGRARVHGVTGLVPDTEASAPKILWLRSHAPEVFRAARLYLQPRDYLYLRLTGHPATDYTLASGTLLLDIRRRTWWPDGCAYVGVTPEVFPPVYDSAEAAYATTPAAAAALGVPADVPVALGAGDRPCEVLGAGAVGERVAVSAGTTTTVSQAAPGIPAALDPRVACSLHAVCGAVLLEQAMSTSGAIVRWLRDTLLGGSMDDGRLAALAQDVPAGADALVFLPFMAGAGATRWDPDARGVWFGLTEAHGIGALARSVLEGIACEVRACVEVLEEMGVRSREVVAVGDGARASLWHQILADMLARPVAVPRRIDAASVGAMLLAAAAIGRVPAVEDAARAANPAGETHQPDAAVSDRYRGLYAVYNQLYDTLRPVFHELAAPAARGE